jgi:3,4-dihydroxy 2-butanone 4-phosphate synthase/GTP cyclohydrolase II
MKKEAVERVHRACEELRAGRMVVLVDDEQRENEGDLAMAADRVTADAINFMARYGRGLICLTLEPSRVEELELSMMVDDNRAEYGTAFTVSVDARQGVTTGISAADRAHTIGVAVSESARPRDLVSPGHVFPLRAVPGGVLQRTGHTEGSVDLARIAGCAPAGVICEIMNEDGTMARMAELRRFSQEHGLLLLSIVDLVQYRLQNERLVKKVAEGEIAISAGRKSWKAHVYETMGEPFQNQMLALTLGEIDGTPTLVRVQVESVLGDVFGARAGTRVVASEAVQCIESAGRGVVLFIPSRVDLATDLNYHLGRDVKPSPQFADAAIREVGFGSQVLMDLGVCKMRLLTNRPRRIPAVDGFDLEVVEQVLLSDFAAEIRQQSSRTTN